MEKVEHPVSLTMKHPVLAPQVSFYLFHPICKLPDDLLDTARSVVTPSVVLPATESTSIQKDTQLMTTIRIVGIYDWTMWKPRDRFRYNSARRQL